MIVCVKALEVLNIKFYFLGKIFICKSLKIHMQIPFFGEKKIVLFPPNSLKKTRNT